MGRRGVGVTVSDTSIAFVQINLDFHEARQTGEITGRAYCLGLHLACEANYVTKRATTSVARLLDDLGWDCSDETVRRYLAELRELGFIDFEMGQGQRRGYTITVTSRLLYERTSTRLPHDFLVEGGDFVEVTSTETSTDPTAGPDQIPDGDARSALSQPPHRLPHRGLGQERSRSRKKERTTAVRGKAGNERDEPQALSRFLPELEPLEVRTERAASLRQIVPPSTPHDQAEAERLLRRHRDIAEGRA
jgi:hypothetical protein